MTASEKTHPTTRWWWPKGTAPRDYADAIIKCNGDPEKIRAIWEAVPDEYKDWVQFYVKDWAAREKAFRQMGARR